MSYNDATSFKVPTTGSTVGSTAPAAPRTRRQEREDEARKTGAADYRSAMEYCINNDLI